MQEGRNNQQYPVQSQDQQNLNNFDQAFPVFAANEQSNVFGDQREHLVATSSGIGNEPIEGGNSADDHHDRNHNTGIRNRPYHRHTSYQTQRLEEYFQDCPHPNDRQRRMLSIELGLDQLQVKFWFQNKRTQLKAQNERIENQKLREENENLISENMQIKNALNRASCLNCGSSQVPGEAYLQEQRLRFENARLRQEIQKVAIVTARFNAQPVTSANSNLSSTGTSHGAAIEFGVRGAQPGLIDGAQGFAAHEAPRPVPPLLDIDRHYVQELAVAAMLEVLEVVQADEPLWLQNNDGLPSVLNEEEYARRFQVALGPQMPEMNTEASRDQGTFYMDPERVIEVLMDSNNWTSLFSTMVSWSNTVQVYSQGSPDGSRDGALQLMIAELHVPSPLVPPRDALFVRYCKKQDEGVWAVIDVSLTVGQNQNINYWRRPSGCLIQEMGHGYSKVLWLEHVKVNNIAVHDMYKPVVCSGFAFGAHRWIATLAKQCECLASLVALSPTPSYVGNVNPQARKSMLKLAERMIASYCSSVSGSVPQEWAPVIWNVADINMKIRSRRNNGVLGRPPGVVVTASTSIWLPVPPKMIYDFLKNETARKEWDILLRGGSIRETAQILNSIDQESGLHIFYLADAEERSNMTILQETCYDPILTYVIYAPINLVKMNTVLANGDPDTVAMMPSGFAILPGGFTEDGSVGSLLTIAFQILAESGPNGSISPVSVKTAHDLVINTTSHIKQALLGEPGHQQ